MILTKIIGILLLIAGVAIGVAVLLAWLPLIKWGLICALVLVLLTPIMLGVLIGYACRKPKK